MIKIKLLQKRTFFWHFLAVKAFYFSSRLLNHHLATANVISLVQWHFELLLSAYIAVTLKAFLVGISRYRRQSIIVASCFSRWISSPVIGRHHDVTVTSSCLWRHCGLMSGREEKRREETPAGSTPGGLRWPLCRRLCDYCAIIVCS